MRRNASTQAGYCADVVATTLDAMRAYQHARGHATGVPWLVGLSGLQGSGKSTLARQLGILANATGVRTEILSLDDFYLGRRDRAHLASTVHPLLATRGVPGTHDPGLLTRTLAALARASPQRPARIPRFDKGRDTRLAPSHWRRVVERPQLILLEGWCVGVPAQAASALARPLNALERDEDRDGRWRHWVNAQLGGAYATLWRCLDMLILLQAPSFAVVARWREQPERALRARGVMGAMDAAAVHRFLMHYERLSRHALHTLPTLADARLVLGRNRNACYIVSSCLRASDPQVAGAKRRQPTGACFSARPRR